MISVIEHNVVEKKKWISHEDMLNIVAIAESTPGAIALNASTYIGARIAGFLGALIASIASMLPSIIIIVCISLLYNHFVDSPYLYWAGLGMRGAVAALILNAVINLGKFLKTERRPAIWAVLIISLTLALLANFEVIHFDNIFIILGTMVIGLIYTMIEISLKKKKASKTSDLISIEPENENDDVSTTLINSELENNVKILSTSSYKQPVEQDSIVNVEEKVHSKNNGVANEENGGEK